MAIVETVFRENENSAKGCRWCGQLVYGSGCTYSPTKKHEQVPVGSALCIRCGKPAYGRGCPHNGAKGAHEHGSGGGLCKWCGQKVIGRGCAYSPTGVHER